MRTRLLISLATLFSSASGAVFESGPARASLIELFTSEGCSSCPPAERWLNNLRNDDRLWREFVPVAFHVSYWDRLGWRDRFASKQFTDRQYAYSTAWRSQSVYTPCFVRDGREWRDRNLEKRTQPDPGVLRLETTGDNTTIATFSPLASVKAGAFEIHVALLGGEIDSKVRSGENSGKTLEHDFVVLHLATATMKQEANGKLTAEIRRPATASLPSPLNAIAAWITVPGDYTPIQAVGGWLK